MAGSSLQPDRAAAGIWIDRHPFLFMGGLTNSIVLADKAVKQDQGSPNAPFAVEPKTSTSRAKLICPPKASHLSTAFVHTLGFREARKDFETALELAQNVNNANLVAQAEQLLCDLDAAEGSTSIQPGPDVERTRLPSLTMSAVNHCGGSHE